MQFMGSSVCKVFSLEALLFTQTSCEGSPCHFAECQQAFTVTTLMLGRKVMPLLSSKIAPGLLVALHLKVSPLSLLFCLCCPHCHLGNLDFFWKQLLQQALEPCFRENGFNKSQGAGAVVGELAVASCALWGGS